MPVVLGRDAVAGAEGPAERGRVRETTAGGDLVDRDAAQGRVRQVASGTFQSLLADPRGDRDAVILEEAVQVAGGDVVCGGDRAGGQARVAQVLLDEGADAQGQAAVAGSPGHAVVCLEFVGE